MLFQALFPRSPEPYMVKIVVGIQTPYFLPPHASRKLQSEVAFLLQSLYHKREDFSSLLTVKYLHRCNQRLRLSELQTHDSKIPNHDLPNHDLPNRTWLKWKYVLHQQIPRHYYRPNSAITTQNMRCCNQRLRAASLYANFWRFGVNLPAIRWAKIRSIHWIKRILIIP